jgi:hypothetical protein
MGALALFRQTAPETAENVVAHIAVIDAIRAARFLIPLVTEAGDIGVTASGLTVDKTQELAIVTVKGPGDRTVLPVFTSVASMAQWRPEARPVPADGIRVALAAAGDGAQWIVIDPGSPTEFVIRRPTVAAIAQSHEWVPPHADPLLAEMFHESVVSQELVRRLGLRAGDPQALGHADELVVELILAPNLSQEDLLGVVTALADIWATKTLISERVDSLRVQLIPDQDNEVR